MKLTRKAEAALLDAAGIFKFTSHASQKRGNLVLRGHRKKIRDGKTQVLIVTLRKRGKRFSASATDELTEKTIVGGPVRTLDDAVLILFWSEFG